MFCIEKLDKSLHDRDGFVSSNHLFDDYLKKFANQDMRRNKTRVYVAVQANDYIPKKIYGYFSINSFALTDNKDAENKKLIFEPYGYISAVLIGRLAIAKDQQHMRGFELLGQALHKCTSLAEELGITMVLVEPVDEREVQFYARQGFEKVGDCSEFMFLPISTLKEYDSIVSKMETAEVGT